MPPTGRGFSSHLVAWHPTSLNHQIISSHTYGCTMTDTPELLQIPCCEASSRASFLYYILSNESEIKEQKSDVFCFLCQLLLCQLDKPTVIVVQRTQVKNSPTRLACEQACGAFSWWLIWVGPAHCEQCYPRLVVLGSIRKQAEQTTGISQK